MKVFSAIVGVIFLALPNISTAGVITTEFNNGDSLSDWSADRRAPADFEIVNNQLEMTISGADLVASAFHNTQGMQRNIEYSNILSVDMYIDPTWNEDQRYGGIWAIGHAVDETTSGWPIIEYHGTQGLSIWDNLGWHYPAGNFIMGEFNTLMFMATGAGIEYYVNGDLVYLDNSGDVDHFGGVILNAKNSGTDYTVVYDNLVFGTAVPEPAPLALLGLGLFGFAVARKRRR